MKPAEPRPCKCGSTPEVRITNHGLPNILRIECSCGNKGAALVYTKPEDEAFMRQAAIDGWDLRI